MRRLTVSSFLVLLLYIPEARLSVRAAEQPAGEPAGFASLAELQSFYTDKIKKTRQVIEAERLAALERLLKTAADSDKQAILLAMIEAAAALEKTEHLLSLSDQYLKGTTDVQDAWRVRQIRFMAMVSSNRVDQAKTEWDKASEKMDAVMDVWQQVFDSAIVIADALLETGRTKDVSDLYKTLRSKFSFVSNLKEVLQPREAALRWFGKTAPPLEGQDLEGKPVDLTQYKGKVVLIDFWATWCPPCVGAMPELIETYKTYNKLGFEIIGISLDQDKQALTRYLSSQRLPWRIICDGKAWFSPNARKYDVTAIPATFLLDRDGRIAYVGTPGKGFSPMVKRLLQPQTDKK
ncbi:MAG: TlpA family protein disulfide reductase [Phycisphaerae bacterium]